MEKHRISIMTVQAALQKFHSTFLLSIVLLTDCLAHAQVNVEPNTALLNEGDRTELLCRYERPITYCRMEIAGEKKVYNLSPDWDKTPGFTYHGSGLQAGQCGVTIERVKAINNGQVKCTLGVEGEEVSGTINLVVAMRPKQPIIELITKPDREGYFHEGSNFEARCTVREGRPAANITWMLDNEMADKRVGQLEVLASPQEFGLELYTTIQAIQWRITAEDNGRKLICRSHHQTDRENVPPQEAIVPLYVRYSPIHLPETVIYGLYLDHTVKVNITIRANPLPIVEWIIDGHLIRQGEQNGRFSAFEPEYLGQDYYNVTLVIAGLSLEDTNRIYHLRATNSLGTTDYSVRLSSSATPPATGLEVGAIVGIVVAVAFLILIVLLVLFARATGRWCFAGKSVKMSPNETSDTESADVKATASTTTTLTTATMIMASEISTPPLAASSSTQTNINKNDNNGHNKNNNNNNTSNNAGKKKLMKVAASAVTSARSAATAATAATKRLPATLTTLLKRINHDQRDQQPLSKCKDATELSASNSNVTSNINCSVNGSNAAANPVSAVASNLANDQEALCNNNFNINSNVNATLTTTSQQQQQQEQQQQQSKQMSESIGVRSKAVENNDNNQTKEDKQLVYAELVLKPSDNNEAPTLPPKSSTEYAEIVYVQKSN